MTVFNRTIKTNFSKFQEDHNLNSQISLDNEL